jgi:triosephosphate isomerase (TIM)
VSGELLRDFANAMSEVARRHEFDSVEFFLAPPNFGLSVLGLGPINPSIKLLAQHVDTAHLGASTGFSVPEIAKSFGAAGSLVNHSEHRIPVDDIDDLIVRLRAQGMISVVCAKDDGEVELFSRLNPDFIAVEPPDLIGSGKAVSKERPGIITDSKRALDRGRPADSKTRLLCGAGIVDGTDALRSVELGAEGILVASGVVKATDWRSKISELARGLSDAQALEAD